MKLQSIQIVLLLVCAVVGLTALTSFLSLATITTTTSSSSSSFAAHHHRNVATSSPIEEDSSSLAKNGNRATRTTDEFASLPTIALPASDANEESRSFSKQGNTRFETVPTEFMPQLPVTERVAVIHVGPGKTGTTTIQNFLQRNRQDLLEQDRFLFLNVTDARTLSDRLIVAAAVHNSDTSSLSSSSCTSAPQLGFFRRFLQGSVDNHTHIIISSEYLASPSWNVTCLLQCLQFYNFSETRIVVGYRRYHEWLQSFHAQQIRVHNRKGITKTTLIKWLGSSRGDIDDLYTEALRQRYTAAGFASVSILNLEENATSSNIAQAFACRFLGRTTYACALAHAGLAEVRANKRRSYIDGALLVEAAVRQGWIPRPLNRNTYVGLAKGAQAAFDKQRKYAEDGKYVATKRGDVPTQCLSPEQQEELLNKSIAFERRLTTPEFFNSPEGVVELKTEFRFPCVADIPRLMKRSFWYRFFTDEQPDLPLPEKRVAVIHVGPSHTETQSLGNFLNHNHHRMYRKDHYSFLRLDNNNRVKLARGLVNCSASILRFLDYFLEKTVIDGKHALISSEYLSEPDLDLPCLQRKLQPHSFDRIHIVMAYERYPEWLKTFHRQYMQLYRSNDEEKQTLIDWLSQSSVMESFVEEKYTLGAFHRYSKIKAFNVSVVNLHDMENSTFVKRFVCDFMPNATEGCWRASKNPRRQEQSGRNLEGSLLLNAAARKGWIAFPNSTEHSANAQTVQQVFDQWWKERNKGLNPQEKDPQPDTLKVCLPPKRREQLMNIAIEVEKTLTDPQFYNGPNGIPKLRDEFVLPCVVDVPKLLNLPFWQNHFLGGSFSTGNVSTV